MKGDPSQGGERVRVAMRVRPLMAHETSRGDENIITTPDVTHVLLNLKTGSKSYKFNAVLDAPTNQEEVFNMCGVNVLTLFSNPSFLCRNLSTLL